MAPIVPLNDSFNIFHNITAKLPLDEPEYRLMTSKMTPNNSFLYKKPYETLFSWFWQNLEKCSLIIFIITKVIPRTARAQLAVKNQQIICGMYFIKNQGYKEEIILVNLASLYYSGKLDFQISCEFSCSHSILSYSKKGANRV